MKLLPALLALLLAATGCGSEAPPTAAVTTTELASTTPQPAPSTIEPSPGASLAPVEPQARIMPFADGVNDAGFDLLRTQDLAENTVLSPASIGHALLMARAAADEPTGSAIDAALGFEDGIAPHDAWNAINQAIVGSNGVAQSIDDEPTPIVTVADRIWPRAGLGPSQQWIDLLASHHGADVQPIDVGQPEESRTLINDWVSAETQGLIPDLLPPGFIDDQTVLVLTNAIYFEAQWQQIFGKYGSIEGEFTRLDGSNVAIELMRELEGRGTRGAGDGFVGANLPYLGDEYSLTLIVPDEGRFAQVRDRLSSGLLAEVDATFTTGPYELLMPRWNTDATIDLLPWLTDIGAAPGHYPAIDEGVFLGGAVHGADIDVDDIGTVAAAATAIGFDESGPAEPELTISADQPFFYVIRHLDSGLVLFTGQVSDPTTEL